MLANHPADPYHAGLNPAHLLQGHAAGVGAAAVARPAAAVGTRRQDGAGGCSCSLLAKANCHLTRVAIFAVRFALGLSLCIAQPVPLTFVCLTHAVASPISLQSVVSVLRNCTENSSQLAAAVAASAAARTATRGGAVDPNRVQQIVEMGFSQAQAEEALRRVSRGPGQQQAGFVACCCWFCWCERMLEGQQIAV